jgi:hypothetical protein
VAIITLLLTVLLLPVTVRLYYRLNKSGLVVWAREGLNVYVQRSQRMRIANQLYRKGMTLREERLRDLGQP